MLRSRPLEPLVIGLLLTSAGYSCSSSDKSNPGPDLEPESCTALRVCCQAMQDPTVSRACGNAIETYAKTLDPASSCAAALSTYTAAGACLGAAGSAGAAGSGGAAAAGSGGTPAAGSGGAGATGSSGTGVGGTGKGGTAGVAGAGGSSAGAAGAAGSGGGCGSLVPPDTSACCTACQSAGKPCQANGCYNGYWCIQDSCQCRTAPSPEQCGQAGSGAAAGAGGSAGSGGNGATGGTGGSGPCADGESQCPKGCANLQTDANNCGSCGVRCYDGNRCTDDWCTDGNCVNTKLPDYTDCTGGGMACVCIGGYEKNSLVECYRSGTNEDWTRFMVGPSWKTVHDCGCASPQRLEATGESHDCVLCIATPTQVDCYM
jgi:hypothetical protein